MKPEKPQRKAKPSDLCLWIEGANIHRPTILPAIVIEAGDEIARLVIFNRSGGIIVKSGVLPYGHPRLEAADGTVAPVGKVNGCWFFADNGVSETDVIEQLVASLTEAREEIASMRSKVNKVGELGRRLTALEKAEN